MKKKIILFGCGNVGVEALNFFGEEYVAYFCDSRNELIGQRKYGKEVISISKLEQIYKDYIVIISTVLSTANEIADLLCARGIDDFLVFKCISENVLQSVTAAEFIEKYSDVNQRRSIQRDYYKYRMEYAEHQLEYLKRHVDIESLKPATGYFRKWQLNQVACAKEFFEFIKELDIKPFLISGGLIGAIRHKGFIPWDDDLDFGLMREDYEKLENFCTENCEVYKYDGDWETYGSMNSPNKIVKILWSNQYKWIWGGDNINEAWVEKGSSYIRTGISFWPFDFYKEEYTLEEHTRYLEYISEKRKELKNIPDIIQFQKEEIRTNDNISKTPTGKIQPGIDNGAWCSRYRLGRGWIRTEDVLPLKKIIYENAEFYVPHNPEKFMEYEYPDYKKFPDDFSPEHIGSCERYMQLYFPTVEFYVCDIQDIDCFLPLYHLFEKNKIYANFVLLPRERNKWGGNLDYDKAVERLDEEEARYSESCNFTVDFVFVTKENNMIEKYKNKKVYLLGEGKSAAQTIRDFDYIWEQQNSKEIIRMIKEIIAYETKK